MSNTILAPEDDSSDFGHNHGPRNQNATRHNLATEVQKLRIAFNPHRVGFGILSWPGVSEPVRAADSVEVAMKYLIEGKGQKDREEKK
jgi:hypothetical protein